MQKLTDNLGRAFVMDFKPGAATTIGTAYVARAVPDGHTLLASTTSYSLASVFYKDLPYDALKDIAPISMMTRRPGTTQLGGDATAAEYFNRQLKQL